MMIFGGAAVAVEGLIDIEVIVEAFAASRCRRRSFLQGFTESDSFL